MQSVRKKIVSNCFQFSITEKLQFDYGIWCGEQFSKVEDVKELMQAVSPVDAKSLFQSVFEEAADAVLSLNKRDEDVMTSTSWLMMRYETYQMIAETESYTITQDLIKKSPARYKEYFSHREKRLAAAKGLVPYLLKTPGVHKSLLGIISSGTLHDAIEMLGAKKMRKPEDQNKLTKLSRIWELLTDKLKSVHHQDAFVAHSIRELNSISEQLLNYGRKNSMDMEKLRVEAKKMYTGVEQTQKRLLRDVSLLKSNLNLGAVRSTQKGYFPIQIEWPVPVRRQDVQLCLQRAKKCDAYYPLRSRVLLAPGSFDGFYEFDRETFIIPAYDDSKVIDHIVSAISDYRLIIEKINGQSSFLKTLESLNENEKPGKIFRQLYKTWLLNADGDIDKKLQKNEVDFLLEYVAPNPKTLFLIHDDFYLGEQAQQRIHHAVKNDDADSDTYHRLAGQYYQVKRYEDALLCLERCMKMGDSSTRAEISRAFILLQMNRHAEAKELFIKYVGHPGIGYLKIFIQRALKN